MPDKHCSTIKQSEWTYVIILFRYSNVEEKEDDRFVTFQEFV